MRRDQGVRGCGKTAEIPITGVDEMKSVPPARSTDPDGLVPILPPWESEGLLNRTAVSDGRGRL